MSQTAIISRDVESELATFDDFVTHLQGSVVLARDVVGDGFEIVKKSALLGNEFLITSYKFQEDGEHGPFVIVRAITRGNRKIAFTDGSTGILRQMRELSAKNILTGIWCQNGLVESSYEYTAEDGKPKSASTYYLAG